MQAHALRPLRTLFVPSKVECLVIVVPDIGLSDPENWQLEREGSWLKILFQKRIPHSHILCFDLKVDPSQEFNWKSFLSKAEGLLDALLILLRDDTIAECPIQLICLGAGGLIVKEAIRTAYQQRENFKTLLFLLSGIAFVGTPHSVSRDRRLWRFCSLLPRLMLSSPTKRSLNDGDIIKLSSLCEAFDDVTFDKPVFSAYEKRSTAVKSAFRTKRVMVVGRNFCSLRIRDENLVEIDTDYVSLHKLDQLSLKKLGDFTCGAIHAAQLRIMVGLDRRRATAPSGLYTVRSESSQGDEDSIKHNTTGNRSAGLAAPSFNFERIPVVADFTIARRKLRLPCYLDGNRTLSRNFFGRSDILEAIAKAFFPKSSDQDVESGRLKTYSLCGLGGVGKTEIAINFMLAHRKKFDAVFWLQADDVAKLREGFSQMAVALNLENQADARDQVVSTNLVKAWLAAPVKNPSVETSSDSETNDAEWLLIFDHVDSTDNLRDFWPEFARRGSILITCREPLAKTYMYSNYSGVDLTPFSDEEAARYLLKATGDSSVAPHDPIPADALAVAHRLGGLPLGLEQMAGVINCEDYTFSEFLTNYDSEKHLRNLTARTIQRAVSEGQSNSVANFWAFQKLDNKSSALLDIISLLDPDSIQEEILKHGLVNYPLANFPQTTDDYQQARADLTKRSLITRDKHLQVLRVHRLTQDAKRALMEPNEFNKNFNATVKLMYNAWPLATLAQRHHTARWKACEASIPSIIRLHDLYNSHDLLEQNITLKLDFAEMLTDAAWYLHERGGGKRVVQFLDLAASICETAPGDALRIMSDIHYTLGAEAGETNQKQVAFNNNIKFLELRRQISKTSKEGTRDPKLAQAYNQAANAYLDMNDIEMAIRYYDEALVVFRSLEDYKETMTTICIANLGTAYWLQGRHEDAEVLLLDNLRARENEFGINDKESFRTGRLLHVLGNVRSSQGRFVEAFAFHNRALFQYQSTVGNDHHRTANLCYKMAEHWFRLGNAASTLKMLKQASRVFETRDFFKAELARMNLLWSKMEYSMGNEEEGLRRKDKALEFFRMCDAHDRRPDDEISETDFDSMVGFRSR